MKSCLKIKGFTLIELLVSISILAMLAAISVSSYPKFSEQMGVGTESFKALAYMREAQVYGVSGYTDPGVKVVYGIEIDRDNNTFKRKQWQNPSSTNNINYVNNLTDTGEASLTVGSKYEIDKICNTSSSPNSCTSDSNYNKAYVLFKRPIPEARMIGMVGNIMYPGQNTTSRLSRLEIHLRSKQNKEFVKKIVILQTGQMYVE